MSSADNLDRWRSFGGTVEEKTRAEGKRVDKLFVAPNGQKLRTWKEALAVMGTNKDTTDSTEATGKKRASESLQQQDDKENKPKKAKTQTKTKATASEPKAEATESAPNPESDASRVVRSSRKAAQGVNYKADQGTVRIRKSDMVTAEDEATCKDEETALTETQVNSTYSRRRLLHFAVVDKAGMAQPLDRMTILPEPLSLTGAIYPANGPLAKANGRAVACFGPVTSWSMEYAADGPAVVVNTHKASYVLAKPSGSYKKVFAGVEEQANLMYEVLQALDPSRGGSPDSSLDEVIAKLARAKAGKGYGSAREALLLNGRFVLQQLAAEQARQQPGADGGNKGKGAAGLEGGAFAKSLEDEIAKGPINVGIMTGNSIQIRGVDADNTAAPGGQDATLADALVAADEEMARRMQAKLDAQTFGANRGGSRGRGGSATAAYIKISEEEIADDYPMPAQYVKEEEETDELVMWDEELADYALEDLPKSILTDFSLYNAEGFFASLELLPMWGGVDPDVELFASGLVRDDEGNFATGAHPLADDNEAAVAAAAAADATSADATAEQAGSAAGGSGTSAGGSGSGAADMAADVGGSAAAAAVAPADVATAQPDAATAGGMRLFLSQIREWVVEYSADMLFISIRTDAAWYRLERPAAKYAPWFSVPLTSARLAVKVIGMLSEEARASRLSFNDVIKKLSEQPSSSSTFISKKVDRVERYVVVHGQIILNQIRHFPKQSVQRSPFVSMLKSKMEVRRHSKLYYSKKIVKSLRGVNRNPMKDRTSARAKPMPATATRMVRSIWQHYFNTAEAAAAAGAEAAAAATAADADLAAGPTAQEVEEDVVDEEQEQEDAEETALVAASPAKKGNRSSKGAKPAAGNGKPKAAACSGVKKVAWVRPPSFTNNDDREFYGKAKIGDWEVAVGDVVLLPDDDDEDVEADDEKEAIPNMALLQCMWERIDGDMRAQVRIVLPGCDTVLGDAAAPAELFVTNDYHELPVGSLVGKVTAARLTREWDPEMRCKHFMDDEQLRTRNKQLEAEGKPQEYFYRHLYKPEEGMFCALLADMRWGSYVAPPQPPVSLAMLPGGNGFMKEGVEYSIGDHIYVHPETFECARAAEQEEQEAQMVPEYAARGGRHKGSTRGLKAFAVAKVVGVKASEKAKSSKKESIPSKVKLQRLYRPEDVTRDAAYKADLNELYASSDIELVDVEWVLRKCMVTAVGATYDGPLDHFVVTNGYDSKSHKLVSLPSEYMPGGASTSGADAMEVDDTDAGKGKAASKGQAPDDKGKGKAPAAQAAAAPVENTTAQGKGKSSSASAVHKPQQQGANAGDDGLALATMDIFAGCGGLSEGMHQAGVADTKWAIEYEAPAADAFKLNYPKAEVFCDNCNVILAAAMQKAGLAEDCTACEDATQQAAQLPADRVAVLPSPGEVEFIMGGPPCQGYSGMNRFNKGNWSMVQNSMVMSFLSYADFYRPRYFLLENVRNFVSHNKSFTFRLTLRTLLDMGYQVRFGVLNAGNYGVPQSRKRTFIWAAAPVEQLPAWPYPRHVFRTPQLTINLPGGVQYTAVPDLPGAPLRTVTVKDAIGDLPRIANGDDKDEREYSGPAVSAFQRFIRGDCTLLRDHICKEMNPLNLERCRCIPKNVPGADWRVLQEIVAQDASREKYNGQPLVPWCLPNTADRHNGWRGLFGRLDLNGHFPTSTTDPQPMGKVGQVFHPDQDRIVSVRECARSQGFPDRFRFSGNVHARHRQVGNAVPPPLAAALGGELRKALEGTRQNQLALLAAQTMM